MTVVMVNRITPVKKVNNPIRTNANETKPTVTVRKSKALEEKYNRTVLMRK